MHKSPLDKMKTEDDETNVASKSTYERPDVQVQKIRLVTLGGTPGSGDSGAVGSQSPPF